MRVRIKDGRAGQLTTRHAASCLGLPVVALADGTALSPGEAGPLELAPRTRGTLRLADLARVAGYQFVGLSSASAAQSRGGRAGTPAQNAARRANGAKSKGRPRNIVVDKPE